MLVFVEELIFAFWYRTTDNQRSTCIINQHRVHLIHDSIVVTTLHEIHWASSHIITEVVKTEFVVSTEGDIASICTAAFVRVRTMFINTIHRQTVEHIERSHPLGVTFGKVVVDCHHVYALVSKRIEEHRQSSHQCFTFTRSHLSDRATLLFVIFNRTMKNYTTNKLDIIVHHIPHHFVASCSPSVMVDSFVTIYFYEIKACIRRQVAIHLGSSYHNGFILSETTSCTLDNSKRIWKNIVERLIIDVQHLFFETINFVVNFFTFINLERLNACFEFDNFRLIRSNSILQALHKRSTTRTQLIITQSIYLCIDSFYFFHIWHHSTHIFLRLIAKKLSNYFNKTHICS